MRSNQIIHYSLFMRPVTHSKRPINHLSFILLQVIPQLLSDYVFAPLVAILTKIKHNLALC